MYYGKISSAGENLKYCVDIGGRITAPLPVMRRADIPAMSPGREVYVLLYADSFADGVILGVV